MILIAVRVAANVQVDLSMQAQCQVFHLLSLSQRSQQPCEVGFMSILQMNL